MSEENVETTQEEVTETSTQEEGLSLNDLGVLRNIIDVASQRGAFKPNEMVAVGQVYQKLDGFLSQIPQKDGE